MIRTEKRIRLCTFFLIANLALIWGNSLLPGSQSGEMSGGVMAFLMEVFRIPSAYEETVHTLIRKAAHFTEFACLGALLTWLHGMAGKKGTGLWCPALLFGILAAMVDETIQMFTPDRGPSVLDVWIDTSGVIFGMTALILGHHLYKRIKR